MKIHSHKDFDIKEVYLIDLCADEAPDSGIYNAVLLNKLRNYERTLYHIRSNTKRVCYYGWDSWHTRWNRNRPSTILSTEDFNFKDIDEDSQDLSPVIVELELNDIDRIYLESPSSVLFIIGSWLNGLMTMELRVPVDSLHSILELGHAKANSMAYAAIPLLIYNDETLSFEVPDFIDHRTKTVIEIPTELRLDSRHLDGNVKYRCS